MGFPFLLLYLIGLYVRLDEQFPVLAPYRIMLWLGVAASITTVFSMLAGKRPTFRAPQMVLMVGLTGMIALSIAFTGWLGGGVAAFEDFASTMVLFFLLVLNITTMKRMRVVAVLLVVLSIFVAGQGVLAYHTGFQEDKFLLQQLIDVGMREGAFASLPEGQQFSADGARAVLPRIRSLGFLNDPNDLAQALLISIPFLFLAWRRRRWLRNTLLVAVPLVFLLYGVFLTRSRGAILGLCILALLAFRWRLGHTASIVLTGLLGLALLGLNFTGGRGFSDSAAVGRVDAWSEGLQLLKESPVWGVGYKMFTDSNEITAHNSFVLCFAELGLVGYFFWLALLVISLLELNFFANSQSEDPDDRDLKRWARAIFLALAVFLVAAFFLSRTYVMTLYILLALGTALTDIARKHERPVFELPLVRWVTRVGVVEFASIAMIYVMVLVG